MASTVRAAFFVQQGLERCEGLPDGVGIRGVFGREDRVRAGGSGWPGRPGAPTLLSWEPKSSRTTMSPGLSVANEDPFNTGQKAPAADRAVEQTGRVDAAVTQRG